MEEFLGADDEEEEPLGFNEGLFGGEDFGAEPDLFPVEGVQPSWFRSALRSQYRVSIDWASSCNLFKSFSFPVSVTVSGPVPLFPSLEVAPA